MTSEPTSASRHYQRLLDHNTRRADRVAADFDGASARHIGIIGAGLMGSSIATNCLGSGMEVSILDANQAAAAATVKRLQCDKASTAIQQADSYASFAHSDLIIESVVETIEVKRLVLQKTTKAAQPDAVLATNTSAIPIAKLAAFVEQPDRFCGIHFCHPELMLLVEVVQGPATSPQTIARAVQFVRSLGKLPVVVNDCAGFVVNRLLAAMINQAVRLLMAGVPLEMIDRSMREFGFQGGPFEIMDVIGIDTCMYAGRTMWEAGLDCVSLSPVLPKLVKKGRLGRKSGRGFYQYKTPRGNAIVDPELAPLIDSYLAPADHEVSTEEIRDQILSAVVREAFQILTDHIVADPHDVDLCIIHGFSFPKSQGGILFWADQVGLAKIVEVLDKIAASEPRMAAPDQLRKMADGGSTFYSD